MPLVAWQNNWFKKRVEIQPIRENRRVWRCFESAPSLCGNKATSCWQLRGHSCSLNSLGNKQRGHRVFDAVTVPVKGEAVWYLQSAAEHLTRDRRGSGGHTSVCQVSTDQRRAPDRLTAGCVEELFSCVFTTGCCFPFTLFSTGRVFQMPPATDGWKAFKCEQTRATLLMAF